MFSWEGESRLEVCAYDSMALLLLPQQDQIDRQVVAISCDVFIAGESSFGVAFVFSCFLDEVIFFEDAGFVEEEAVFFHESGGDDELVEEVPAIAPGEGSEAFFVVLVEGVEEVSVFDL